MSDPAPAGNTDSESFRQRAIAGALRAFLRLTLSRTLQAGLPFEQQRRRLHAAMRLTMPRRGTSFVPSNVGGVPGAWVHARGLEHAPLTILYLHGGGYCVGSPVAYRALAGHLAVRCVARVFAADYRLAPEHPFPAAVDDAATAYRGLLATGTAPEHIVIAGDSAGGGLTVAAALRTRELGQPLPRALVLFSPLLDLTFEQIEAPPAGDAVLTLPWLVETARAYVARGNPRHPLASPIGARLDGLPPTLIQVGTDELLLNDSRRMHQRLQQAGVTVRLEEYVRRWHVFQATAGMLADADHALDAMARFIDAAAPIRRG